MATQTERHPMRNVRRTRVFQRAGNVGRVIQIMDKNGTNKSEIVLL
ncbi:hypothetical protein ACSVHC_23520 [Arthrobacter sp. KNU-44]